MKSQTKDTTKKSNFDRENIIEDYHELLQYYNQPNDDDLVEKLQELSPTDKSIFVLYIACECRYGILARMLCTNIKYAKNLIENIKIKLNQ